MKLLFTILILLSQGEAYSHPVIYKGGVALSTFQMPEISNSYAMYSVTQKLSVGADHWRFEDSHTGYLKLNGLLYRSNREGSQANLYLHSGLGLRRGFTAMAGAEADWETRRLFTSLKRLEFETTSLSQVRLGFSPVLAGFEELQTWVMLQGMHLREVSPVVSLVPLLRFFYHNVLWELGSSVKGEWLFSLMVHY